MQWWYDLSEIVRNLGLVLGAAVGIYIAWQRVQAANKQAEAQIRQARFGAAGSCRGAFQSRGWTTEG